MSDKQLPPLLDTPPPDINFVVALAMTLADEISQSGGDPGHALAAITAFCHTMWGREYGSAVKVGISEKIKVLNDESFMETVH